MRFQWAAEKSELNLRRRGFDFAFASQIFERPVLVEEDGRRDYGETRERAIGIVDGIELVVVYTDRLDAGGKPVRRIISARRANRKERRAYHDDARGRAGDPDG